MATNKTWLWVVLGGVAVCVLALFGMAGAGVYFVSRHIDARHTSSGDALRQFDDARAALKDRRPLVELDDLGRARETRPLDALPTAAIKTSEMVILAWDPDKERTVRVRLPFWLLSLGRRKIDIMGVDDRGFDIQRLNLDFTELERVGPQFVLDYRTPAGKRVLIWTE